MCGGLKPETHREIMSFAEEVKRSFADDQTSDERMRARFMFLSQNLSWSAKLADRRADLIKIAGFCLAWIEALEKEIHERDWKPSG